MVPINSTTDELLSPTQAAARSGFSKEWLRLLGQRGAIDVLHTPLGRLYPAAQVDRLRERSPRGRRSAVSDRTVATARPCR